jgi:hypothetical protein
LTAWAVTCWNPDALPELEEVFAELDCELDAALATPPEMIVT